jgi:hypothetical protein
MKTPAPRAVGELLTSALPQITDRLLEIRIRRAWPSIVGRDAARWTAPDALSGGTLRVVVSNSPGLHEMTLRSREITTAVREQFPEVHQLRFVLGTVEQDDARAIAQRPRAVALTAADRADIDAAAAAISDSGLAEVARRLLTTARRFPRARQASRGAV